MLTVYKECSIELGRVATLNVDGGSSDDFPANKRCLRREPYKADRDVIVESDCQGLVRPRQWRQPGAPGELRRRVKLRTKPRNLDNRVSN